MPAALPTPAPSAALGPASAHPLALAAGLAVVVVWGANFAVQKALFEVLSPAAFMFARYLVMPLAALLMLLAIAGTNWPRLPREDLRRIAFLGVIGHTVHVSLVSHGIHWSTAFSSALILACGPVFTLLILHASGIERLTRHQVLGVALACAGVLAFLSDKLLARQWAATGGDLVLLFASSLFSYYTVASKPLIQRHGGKTVMAYATLAGSPLVVLMNIPAAAAAPWASMGAQHWALLLWSSFVAAFLGWLVWGWVNERRGVGRTAPLMYLMPLVAGVFAWWATGERFGAVKIVAALVTVGGVALAQFGGRMSAASEAPAQVD
jgi:drug/metabolite transporter (DMT)-like permease